MGEGRGLRVEGVSVTLGGTPVLDDVSFDAPAGRTTAVLGPSGCGKTTLLRVVAGLQTPSAGRVLAGERDVTAVPVHRRGIGLAFQDGALFPHLDVAGNVGFGLRMTGVPATEAGERVEEVLAMVGLQGFGGRRVGGLSGGERQRVALARALAPDPAVLCLDEPLGSIDRVLHDRLVDELGQVFASLLVTVLLVTHDHTEALALADHLVVLDADPDGGPGSRVVAAGSPPQVWMRPPTVAVARFLGHQVLSADAARALGVGDGDIGGARWVVVHPTAVQLSPGDGGRGRVVEVTFGGERSTVVVEIPGVGRVRAGVAVPPGVGEFVAVRVDPAGVWGIN